MGRKEDRQVFRHGNKSFIVHVTDKGSIWKPERFAILAGSSGSDPSPIHHSFIDGLGDVTKKYRNDMMNIVKKKQM